MARSQETFNKKEVRNKKEQKRKEKAEKRAARKENKKKGSLDDMIAYVDENGMIIDTPPDPTKKKETKLEDIQISVPKREALPKEDPIRNGVVTFYNDSKGFGFIKDTSSQESIFVHVSNIQDEIYENSKVTFETEMGHKGLTAIKVKISE